MQQSNVPAKFPIAWGQNAGGSYIRSVPQASQIGIQNGAASLHDGFPPLCFLTAGLGGYLPFGEDMNGILNLITSWNQWSSAGNAVRYDATFSTEIGGYPQGALLAATTAGGMWVSTVDNNISNPDTGGAGWLAVATGVQAGRLIDIQIFATAGSATYTAASGVNSVIFFAKGGGGGGGSNSSTGASQASAGGGGGSGAFAVARYTSSFSPLSLTVGGGGAGGYGANGAAGTSTLVGSLLTVPAGSGGSIGSVSTGGFTNPGAGGSAPTGSGVLWSQPGEDGQNGIVLPNYAVQSGAGGAGVFGANGSNTASGTGTGGRGFGAGGGGSGSAQSTSSIFFGGAGSGGLIVALGFT